MAFVVGKEVTFPLGETYRGPTAVVQFDFPFVFAPFIDPIDQLNVIVQLGLFSLSIIPEVRDNYLGYKLAVDDKGGFTPDRYQVTVFVAGETEAASGTIGPFPPFASQPAWTEHRRLAKVTTQRGRVSPHALIAIPPLVGIIVAIGILLVFVSIAYNIFTGRWGPAAFGWGIVLPIALVAGGVYLVSSGALGGRRRTPAIRGR